jgi:hypothetical protein
MYSTRILLVAALAVGLALLLLNAAGTVASYPTPHGAIRPRDAIVGDQVRHWQPKQAVDEPDAQFLFRVADGTRRRFAYWWDQYSARVSPSDNWVLAAAGLVAHAYRAYEFVDPERALARGYGVCTQYVNVVFAILKRNGFRPRSVLFPRHTVIAVPAQDGELVVDALYGIVIPKSIAQLRAQPQLVEPYYLHVTREKSPSGEFGAALAATMMRAYAGKVLAVNTGNATPRTARVEPAAYFAKWSIPLLLVVLAGLGLRAVRTPRISHSS